MSLIGHCWINDQKSIGCNLLNYGLPYAQMRREWKVWPRCKNGLTLPMVAAVVLVAPGAPLAQMQLVGGDHLAALQALQVVHLERGALFLVLCGPAGRPWAPSTCWPSRRSGRSCLPGAGPGHRRSAPQPLIHDSGEGSQASHNPSFCP